MTCTAQLRDDLLHDVLECLWCIRHKWKNLGLALGLDSTTLEVIEKDHPCNTDDCFAELLKKWLHSGRTSWRALVKALHSPLVGVVAEEGTIRLVVQSENYHFLISYRQGGHRRAV